VAKTYELICGICNKTIGYVVLSIPNDGGNTIKYTISGDIKEPIRCVECERLRRKNSEQ
jgi:hypothetical protein